MSKENLYQPFEVLIRQRDTFPVKEHQHSFFEATYVASGEGILEVYRPMSDPCKFKYVAGSLFLIPPNTTHCFSVSKRSKFIFVRFTDRYIDEQLADRAKHSLYLSYATARISLSGTQLKSAETLFELIESELALGQNFSEKIIQNSANIVLMEAARFLVNSADAQVQNADETAREMHMVQYIQTHIHQPSLLRIDNLVRLFGLSKNYIGRYFKDRFQESLQQYIARNRIKRVEYLAANSLMSIKEIAYDMGFADSSHLIKFFKRHCGMSPMQYRAMCNSPKRKRTPAT